MTAETFDPADELRSFTIPIIRTLSAGTLLVIAATSAAGGAMWPVLAVAAFLYRTPIWEAV